MATQKPAARARFDPSRTAPQPILQKTGAKPEPIALKLPGLKCFGCSSENPHGLKLKFYRQGNQVISQFTPKAHLQGWYGTVHGGVLSTCMDELGTWTVAGLLRRIGVTRDLNIHYRRPLYINEPVKMVGEIKEESGPLAMTSCQLLNARGDVCVDGEVNVFLLEEAQFVKMVPLGKVPPALKPFFLAR